MFRNKIVAPNEGGTIGKNNVRNPAENCSQGVSVQVRSTGDHQVITCVT